MSSREDVLWLLLAKVVPHLDACSRLSPHKRSAVIPENVVHLFARSAIQGGAGDLLPIVEDLHGAGLSYHEVVDHLIAPAARQLGVWWELDEGRLLRNDHRDGQAGVHYTRA